MNLSEKTGLFPGTFDPLTNGHVDVIRRGRTLFDRLVIAVGTNPGKRALFSTSERLQIIRAELADLKIDAAVEAYDGLTVDYARRIGALAILRGLRNATDLNFEFQLALTNRAVADIETVFIMTGETYGFTSSSLIKQIAASGDIDRLRLLLPTRVIDALKLKSAQLATFRVDGLKE